MSDSMSSLARQYSVHLRNFAAHGREDILAQAYSLGRAAIAIGFGVLDMARVHQRALSELLDSNPPANALSAGEMFFLEALAPFEATQRGFRETNENLQRANGALKKRNLQLAAANQKLTAEIRERRKTQGALRVSREHFRKLFRQAQKMQQNLRDLSDRILHAQEEERKRISRELHDETSQALTVISVMLASLKQRAPEVEVQHQRIRDAQELLQETMTSLHDFARDLRPPSLDGLGLLPPLRSWLGCFGKRTGLRVSFRASSAAEKLDANQKTALYRIAQESLTNIVKHARATRVDLTIRHEGRRICMVITNNGIPFCPQSSPAQKRSHRLGLLGMQERVRLVKGEFTIRPHRRKGTTLRVCIPLPEEKLARARRFLDPPPGGSIPVNGSNHSQTYERNQSSIG